jgi:flavin-dependent dehydrogenase
MFWGAQSETIAIDPNTTPPPATRKTGWQAAPGFLWDLGPITGLPARTIPELEAQRRQTEHRRTLVALGCAAGIVLPLVAGLAVWVI